MGAPFASGLLARGSDSTGTYEYRSADAQTLGRVKAIEAICTRHGTSLLAAALRFPLGHPSVPAVVPGPRNAEHMTDYIAAMADPIPGALWHELRQHGLIRPDAPVPASGPN